MPHVSVIIPVYNSARLIGHALQSVFDQTFRNFEVVVVDDGSEDRQELASALREWAERIQSVRQPNGGPASARNTGIARARGDLIAFLDADDEWMPEKLARQVDYFDRHPETGLLHTAVVGASRPQATTGPPRHVFCDLFHTVFFVNTLTVMVPRAVLDAVGGFDERREVHIEDWDLWLRIAASYPFGYLAEPLARHRPGGWMSSQVERTYAAQALVIDKNKALCRQACSLHRANPARCERKRFYVLNRDWGYDRLVAGDRRGARQLLGRAVALSSLEPRTAALYLSTFIPYRGRARARTRRAAAPPANLEALCANEGATRAGSNAEHISLVHDTVYRRLRRRVLARLHDVDDAVWHLRGSRKAVLFDAASSMSVAIFRPIYERLRRDPRIELWFTAHGQVWQPQEIFGPSGITANIVAPSRASRMKVDLYVNADFWDMTWLHRRTRRIHLFHGVAGKYGLDTPVDLAPTIAVFDSLMFANTDRRQRYIDAGLVPDDGVKAALIGYPKVDCLVDGSLDRAAILRSLGLDPAVQTLVYAPTWSPDSSLNGMGEEIIERVAAEGLQLIVKLHDRSYDRRQRGAGGIDWAQRLSKYDGHPRVRVVRGADSSPFLAASDLLISDHSSVAFEFMLLNRPIVIVDRPGLIRKAAINPEKVLLLRSAAQVVNDTSALTRAVIAGLRHPRLSADIRRRIAAELFYRAGSATDRAVALIYRVMEMEEYAEPRAVAEPTRVLSEAG